MFASELFRFVDVRRNRRIPLLICSGVQDSYVLRRFFFNPGGACKRHKNAKEKQGRIQRKATFICMITIQVTNSPHDQADIVIWNSFSKCLITKQYDPCFFYSNICLCIYQLYWTFGSPIWRFWHKNRDASTKFASAYVPNLADWISPGTSLRKQVY